VCYYLEIGKDITSLYNNKSLGGQPIDRCFKFVCDFKSYQIKRTKSQYIYKYKKISYIHEHDGKQLKVIEYIKKVKTTYNLEYRKSVVDELKKFGILLDEKDIFSIRQYKHKQYKLNIYKCITVFENDVPIDRFFSGSVITDLELAYNKYHIDECSITITNTFIDYYIANGTLRIALIELYKKLNIYKKAP